MKFVVGRYDSKISEKHQVIFPKRFREVLGETVLITKGLDGHLLIVSQDDWSILTEGTGHKPFTNKATREVQRYLFGNATEVTLDDQGRFVLPEYLRTHAHITKDVVFAGVQKYVELWDRDQWEAHQAQLSEGVSSVAEQLDEKTNE